MPLYHIYFVDETGRIMVGEDHECHDDASAVRVARTTLRQSDYPLAEIWDHDKRVGTARHFSWVDPHAKRSEPRAKLLATIREGAGKSPEHWRA
jgi:hypothetical protein